MVVPRVEMKAMLARLISLLREPQTAVELAAPAAPDLVAPEPAAATA
jgi:hypothetical protein